MKKSNPDVSAQISWVYTENLDSTADFYGRILGFECSRDEGSARIFNTGAAFIGVCKAFEDRVVEPRGGMISIVTDDVDRWYRRLLDHNVLIDSPPERLEQFGVYSFLVRDPNGYVIEFQAFDR